MIKHMKKLSLVALGAVGLSSNAMADVSFADGAFTGTFDLSPFYSAIGIVVTAIAVVAAIRLAISAFKRVT